MGAKFLEVLEAKLTNLRTPERSKSLLHNIMTAKESHDFCSTNYLDIYKIEVTLGVQRAINPNDLEQNPYLLKEEVFYTRKMINEAIFGEFREDIYLLRNEIALENYGEARKKLDELMRKMFDV